MIGRGDDVCDADPGYPVAVTLTASLRRMTEIWRGDLSLPMLFAPDSLAIHGPEPLRRALPGWFTLSDFAPVTWLAKTTPRSAAG